MGVMEGSSNTQAVQILRLANELSAGWCSGHVGRLEKESVLLIRYGTETSRENAELDLLTELSLMLSSKPEYSVQTRLRLISWCPSARQLHQLGGAVSNQERHR